MEELLKILLVVLFIISTGLAISGVLIGIWFDPDTGIKLALSGLLVFICMLGLILLFGFFLTI